MHWNRIRAKVMQASYEFYCDKCQVTHSKVEVHQSVKDDRYYLLMGPHMTTHKSFKEARDYIHDHPTGG
jgi:hypothetical protein